jgi:hypothetical protein
MFMNRAQQANSNPRQARAEFWSRHIENWSNSDLTQVEYCRQNALNRYTFGYWKSKLNKKETYRPFLPVSIQPEASVGNSSFPSGISLSFKDRFDVRLEVGFNCDTLSRLIDVLETR